MRLPLKGYRVIDLSRLLPGPFCTMLMADYGAEVIKVETPSQGDYLRNTGGRAGASPYFSHLNRNKQSVTLNLKHPVGKEIFVQLVKTADVLLEGFRPGVMENLGLGYKTLTAVNPGLVWCSISGYGSNGPYHQRAGHDNNYLSIAGLLGLNGYKDGPPQLPAVQIADIGSGALMALTGILMALLARAGDGCGDFVDISMTDGALSWLVFPAVDYFTTGTPPRRGEMILSGRYACYNIYATADGGFMSLGALEPKFWQEFCATVGHPEWKSLQFAEGDAGEKLIKSVSEMFMARSRREWEKVFAEVDICCEPVLTLEESLVHPQIVARNMVIDVPCSDGSKEKQLGFPIKFAASTGKVKKGAPGLGADNEQVYGSMGYSADDLVDLKKQGII